MNRLYLCVLPEDRRLSLPPRHLPFAVNVCINHSTPSSTPAPVRALLFLLFSGAEEGRREQLIGGFANVRMNANATLIRIKAKTPLQGERV